MPVLPAVPSTIIPPGRKFPRAIASFTMASPARSFTDPPGFMNSALPKSSQPVNADAWRSLMSGVFPIASMTLAAMLISVQDPRQSKILVGPRSSPSLSKIYVLPSRFVEHRDCLAATRKRIFARQRANEISWKSLRLPGDGRDRRGRAWPEQPRENDRQTDDGHAVALIFPPCNRAKTLFDGCLVAFRDIVPIHEIVDEGLEIIGAAIAVVDVIGMLPDIDGQNRHRSLEQRIFGVPRLRHGYLAILDHEPSPTGTELCRTALHQVLLDLFDRSKSLDKRLFELAWNFTAAIWLD